MKKIGVAIATYNGEKYITEQLMSIINQTIRPNTIVISDGGSEDNTVRICEELLNNCGIDFEILKSNEQLDVVHNFEKAYTSCNAEYVFFADQDDVWKVNKIQTVIELMEEHQAIMGFTNAEIVNEELKSVGKDLWSTIGFKSHGRILKYSKSSIVFVNRLLQRNVVTGMCMCVHNSAKSFLLPFSQSTIHDVWVALICANLGTVICIDEKCVLYRQHGNNAIGTKATLTHSIRNGKKYKQRIYNRAQTIRDIRQRLNSNVNKEIDNAFVDYLNYIMKRERIISKKESILSIVPYISKYQRYEVVPCKVLIRDLICRAGVL